MRKKITALGCAVFVTMAICLVGASEIGRITFEKGSVIGILFAVAAVVLQGLEI